MDIVKELTQLHELAGETTILNFRGLMQNKLRELITISQATPAPSIAEELAEVLDELAGLVEDSNNGAITLDTFTTQPAREVLARYCTAR